MENQYQHEGDHFDVKNHHLSAPGGDWEIQDDSEILTFTLPLDTDERRSTHLGSVFSSPSRTQVNSSAVPPSAPIIQPFPEVSGLTLAEASRKMYFSVSLRSVEFGFYEDTPACLLVFTFCFPHQSFSSAEVELEFKDAPSGSNPFIASESGSFSLNRSLGLNIPDEERKTTPTVLDWKPEKDEGVAKTAPLATSFHCSIPFGVAGVAYSSVQYGQSKVSSSSRGMLKNCVVWKFAENSVSKEGIAGKMTCAVAVGTKQGNRFAGRVKLSAEVGGRTLRVAKGKDLERVVYFEPGGKVGGGGVGRRNEKLVGGTVQLGNEVFEPRPGAEAGGATWVEADLERRISG